MPYTNEVVPLIAAWPACVDPARITARLWRGWRTIDNAGRVRRLEAEDERASVSADGTFSFQGGPGIDDFPVPRPVADGIALTIDLPNGPVFRSGMLGGLPPGPPEDPNGFVEVFVMCDAIAVQAPDLAARELQPPITLDESRTVTRLTFTFATGQVDVNGAGTDTSLAGVNFSFSCALTLAPSGDARNPARVLTVGVSPITLTFTGTGTVRWSCAPAMPAARGATCTQGNPRELYAMLFSAAAETLLEFGENPRWLGGEIAATHLSRRPRQVPQQPACCDFGTAPLTFGVNAEWFIWCRNEARRRELALLHPVPLRPGVRQVGNGEGARLPHHRLTGRTSIP